MHEQVKKSTLRLNFFDILLIVLAVLIIAAGAALIIYKTGQTSDEVRIQYTVLVKEIPDETVIKAEPGQSVVDTIRLGTIGEVVSYEIVPSTYDEINRETNAIVHGVYDDVISVSFTFEGNAVIEEEAYMIENVRIVLGSQIFFRTPSFTGFGFVTDVTEITE